MQLETPPTKPHKSLAFRAGRGATLGFAKILLFPGMTKLFNHTFLGGCRYVNILTAKGETKKSLEHLIKLLDGQRFKTKHTYRWWYLMRQAVSMAQDKQIDTVNLPLDSIHKLMSLIPSSPDPKHGYDAAYSFIGFGLWAFQAGDRALAIQYVQQAILADSDWGYPEYLMGWLGLFEDDIDSITHFVNALRVNWSFFHRINRDPVCQQHPEIIRKVRQQVLMNSSSQRH